MDSLSNNYSTEKNDNFQERFDRGITEYMVKHRISQGAVCVMRGDETLIHQGYGTSPDTIFRIASLTKPITRAAIKLLISKGKLSLDTKAFPLLDLQPIPGEKVNPQLEQITIDQLLNHKGGWDTTLMGYDPMAEQTKISKRLGKPILELKPEDFVTFMLSKPLQSKPGTKYFYSNLGYTVLGRVIEKVSGLSYEAFIKGSLMDPLGVSSIKIGSSNPDKSENNEAIYEPDDEYYPHDGYLIEMIDSCGGLISTATDYCKFMKGYWLTGDKRKTGEKSRFTSFGGLPGTKAVAMQRLDGTNAVILFNKRDVKNPNDHVEVVELVESLLG